MYTVIVVASEVRERSENVIRSDEGEDRKEEENEQADEREDDIIIGAEE